MIERRKRIMKRLLIEELEHRTMLAAGPPQIAMAATGLTNNSLEDFYKAQVGTEIGGPAGVYMLAQNIGPLAISLPVVDAVASSLRAVDQFDATSSLGQLTLTTGTNTPGIGSFATPTAGPSRAGGTGNPNQMPSLLRGGQSQAATDRAIESLFDDPEGDGSLVDAKPENVTQRVAPESLTGSRDEWHDESDDAAKAGKAEPRTPAGKR